MLDMQQDFAEKNDQVDLWQIPRHARLRPGLLYNCHICYVQEITFVSHLAL